MLTVTCPNCDKVVKMLRNTEDKKIKCPWCRKPISVPTKDDDEAPRKLKKPKKKAGSNLGLIIGLGACGAVLLLVIVVVAIIIVGGRRGPAAVPPGGPPQPGLGPVAGGGGGELKTQIVGKWIGTLGRDLKLDTKPGKESFIEFDDKGTYSSNFAQTDSGSYKVLDRQTIELTYLMTTGVPVGARTTVIPDTVVNGRVKEGHTLIHEKRTVQMTSPYKMSITRQGGDTLDFERSDFFFQKK